MLKFRPAYFIAAIIIFIIEVLIALYIHDDIIRPYIGDTLVVILIYCFLRAFINSAPWKIATFTLLFAYTVEILQYFNIIEKLGLENSKLARVVIGTSFAWTDLLAYTAGIIFILFIERKETRENN